jgi:hypothetical protein
MNIHAEEIAIKRLNKLNKNNKNNKNNKKNKNNKNNNNNKKNNIKNKYKIIIWKQNKEGQVRPVYCCCWCMKLLLKNGYTNDDIMTFSICNNKCILETSMRKDIIIKPLIKNKK